MVLVFNKDFLSCYLITLMLKENVDAGLQNSPTRTPTPTTSRGENVHNVEGGPKSPESEWVISIKEKLEQANKDNDAGSWAKLSIYRVPLSLRRDDDKAYIPQIVSLGPYHHGKRRLRNMDSHKWRAVFQILKRTDQEIKMYIDAVRELEEKARACYEGTIAMSSNDFVEMMVRDSCFVLELFRGVDRGFEHLGYARNDPVFARQGSMHSIHRDMIMIENQIPLFILDRLYGIQSDMPCEKGKVARLALNFFNPFRPTDEILTETDLNKLESSMGRSTFFDPLADLDGLHCLDVFSRSLLQRGIKPTLKLWIRRWPYLSRVEVIRSVSELKEAGVKFKKRNTGRFWDVKFENGILKMPRLLIHDGSKSLFLNLIAFEQCHLDCANVITAYVIFLDNLIDSPEDVKYPHYCGIIKHWLGNDAEVAALFDRLSQEVAFDLKYSYLSKPCQQINRYCEHRWNGWRATLTHKYFNNPWAIISFAAAVILILLTIAQTFYAVYGYYRPPQ